MDADERYRSRKWILHKNFAIWIVSVATSLMLARSLGVQSVPDVSSILNWTALTMGAVLGAYSAANILGKKVTE